VSTQGGSGGTQSGGGAGGVYSGLTSNPGGLGYGGVGDGGSNTGGGGGGGYFGGGGGGWSGGGGGSSYTGPFTTNFTHTPVIKQQMARYLYHGILLHYVVCTSGIRTPVTVTVNNPSTAATSASASPAVVCAGLSTTLSQTEEYWKPCKLVLVYRFMWWHICNCRKSGFNSSYSYNDILCKGRKCM